MATEFGLENLVQKSQKLNRNIQNAHVPQIRRNPLQLHDVSVALARKRPLDERTKNKAQYILAKKGFDSDKLQRDLSNIDIKTTFESVQSIQDTDLEGYLEREHELLLLTVIEESKKETIQYFINNCSIYMDEEWERNKIELVNFFNQKESLLIGNHPLLFPSDSPLNNTFHYAKKSSNASILNFKMRQYAKVIYEWNESVAQSKKCDILSKCTQVVTQCQESHPDQPKEILLSWQLLQSMLDSNPNLTPSTYRLGALTFLESQYWSWLKTCVSQNLSKAHMTSMPAIEEFVKAYLNVIFLTNETSTPNTILPDCTERLSDGQPLYAVLFFMIRCGHWKSALSLSQSHPATVSTFYPQLKHVIDSRIDNKTEIHDKIRLQIGDDYRQALRQGKDIYKQLLLNLLGKCDPYQNNDQIPHWSTEDYMWFKLHMVTLDTNVDGSNQVGQLGWKEWQDWLWKSDPNHYQNPLLYFEILLLSAQFERALYYLASTHQYPADTLHFALVLAHYRVLKVSSDRKEFVKERKDSDFYFDLTRQIREYISQFAHIDILMTLHYIALIKDEIDRHQSIRDLIMDTSSFKEILGYDPIPKSSEDNLKLESNGGYLIEFVDQVQWKQIVYLTAKSCQEHGQYEIAIQLYHLAQEPMEAIELANTQLAQRLTCQNLVQQPIYQVAKSLSHHYQSTFGSHPNLDSRYRLSWEPAHHSFTLLLGLVQFFHHYQLSHYQAALDEIQGLQLLSFHMREMDQKVQSFHHIHDGIRQHFADILLTTMDCLYQIYLTTKALSGTRHTDHHSYCQTIKSHAKAIVIYAGMIQFRMPGDTHSRLVRLEASMA